MTDLPNDDPGSAAAPDERVFHYETGGGYVASMTAPQIEKHFATFRECINALEADKAALVEALQWCLPYVERIRAAENIRNLLSKHGGA